MEMRLEMLYSRHTDRQTDRREDRRSNRHCQTEKDSEGERETNDGAKFLANAFSRLINFRSRLFLLFHFTFSYFFFLLVTSHFLYFLLFY